MDLSEFAEIFFEEASELLATMEQLLLGIDIAQPDNEQLHAIFRAAHSIKGGASTFGMPEITEVTHVLENLLDKLRNNRLVLTREHVDAFLQAKDVLRAMLDARQAGSTAPADAGAPVMQVLHAMTQGETAPAPAAKPAVQPTAEPAPEPAKPAARSTDAIVDQALADGSFGLFEPVATTPAAAPAAAMPAPVPVVTAPALKAPAKEADKPKSAESSTLRVGVEKVDALINMVGELVITHAMIEQLTSHLDPMQHQRLLASVTQLARNTRNLQESVLGIRMLPMDIVFSRFPRLVRDLAAKLGKRIDFVTHGAATELDKSLTERLVDPLTHLVRNSIDHGIEMPEKRLAAGKSETGRLTLSAAHQGGNVIVEVSDDGGGLNRERILAKAKQQGLPVSDSMPDDEVWQLIFAPGFSTAEVVTDVSGRGVGMDVVKRNIAAMGGSVEIRSAAGFGSSVRIALPLTLAILDGMSVKVGDEIYILALSSVIESLQPEPGSIKDVMGQGQVLEVRDEYLPVVAMHKMFGITPKHTDPCRGIVVILESEGKKLGLQVDELVGQQQVVVKSLESNYRRVIGISGATILGDGSVALILDVPTLVRQSRLVSANEPVRV
jgi:two-component system, chemotaxis family, sensor kinase CheA